MAAPRVDPRLAPIPAVDVVGYSRLIGVDEAGPLVRVKVWSRSKPAWPSARLAARGAFGTGIGINIGGGGPRARLEPETSRAPMRSDCAVSATA
jgi:hypothetical protein